MTIWCDPPPVRWAEFLNPVMERPGNWALARKYATRSQAEDAYRYLVYARRAAVPKGHWEFAVRAWAGEFGLWARWLGPEGAQHD